MSLLRRWAGWRAEKQAERRALDDYRSAWRALRALRAARSPTDGPRPDRGA